MQTSKPLPEPAIEPVIPHAHVSTVSTLEGRRITRILYELRFVGRKPIVIQLPEGQNLQRVYLNGVATLAESVNGRLELEVAPARAGEEGGSLELVLAESGGEFHLAGSLHFNLPVVSWPTHEMDLTLHLPRVFDYAWAGGSLSPQAKAVPVEYSHVLPLPGKSLSYSQVLIADSRPDLDLHYKVALEGQFFDAGAVSEQSARVVDGEEPR